MRLTISHGRGSNIYLFSWRFHWYRRGQIYLGVNVWRNWVSFSWIWRDDIVDSV